MISITRQGLKHVFAAALCCVACLSAAAEVITRGSTVIVNGSPVIKIKSSAGGLSAETRAGVVAALLDSMEGAISVEARKTTMDWILLANGSQLTTITAQEAKLHGVSQQALAQAWVAKLKAALNMPAIELGTTSLTVPLGTARGVALRGHKARVAQIESSSPEVAGVERVAGGFRVHAKGNGFATITVRHGSSRQQLDVTVKPWAVPLPQSLSAEVTGVPATGSVVRGAVEYALRTHLRKQNQTLLRFDLPEAGALGIGRSRTFNVRVRGTAPGSLESIGYAKVVVRNQPLSKVQDDELWYCNSPEVVKTIRNLFAAPLKKDTSARMLYHHINAAGTPLFMRIQAINESDVPAKVQVFAGDAEPHTNPVQAGIEAGDKYMRSWMVGSGEILTVPPHSTIPISLRRVSPEETMSGLCSLRLVDGPAEIMVRTDSLPPFPLDERWSKAEASSTPWRDVGANAINMFDTAPYETSSLIFPNPYKAEQVSYEVGGRHGYVRIGQKPITRTDLALNLDGNFGVIYSIKASLQNPTSTPTDVEVVFEASAGYSGGLFLINGSLQRTPLLFAKQEARVAKVHLPAGASRVLNITTVPLSGSSYPATLTVRPIHTVAMSTQAGRKN